MHPGCLIRSVQGTDVLWSCPVWNATLDDPVASEVSGSDVMLVVSVFHHRDDQAALVIASRSGALGFIELTFVELVSDA